MHGGSLLRGAQPWGGERDSHGLHRALDADRLVGSRRIDGDDPSAAMSKGARSRTSSSGERGQHSVLSSRLHDSAECVSRETPRVLLALRIAVRAQRLPVRHAPFSCRRRSWKMVHCGRLSACLAGSRDTRFRQYRIQHHGSDLPRKELIRLRGKRTPRRQMLLSTFACTV